MFGYQIARGLVARRMPLMAKTSIPSKASASIFVSRLPLLNQRSPLKRAFGSASSDHGDHHHSESHGPTKYARPGEGSLQIWMIGSAVLFLPIVRFYIFDILR
jgi:hypothetical protein